jgi:hypothetical protein
MTSAPCWVTKLAHVDLQPLPHGREVAHIHHLEQEQREHADVVAVAAQEEPLQPEQAVGFSEQTDRVHVVERRGAPEHRHRTDAPICSA